MAIEKINKITEKEIPEVIEFISDNCHSQYEAFKSNKKKLYKNFLNKFINDKTKFAYFLKDKGYSIGGVIMFEELLFDTKLFGSKTAQIWDIIIDKDLERNDMIDRAKFLIEFTINEMNKLKVKFIQCKVDSRNIYVAQILESFGFKLTSVDLNLIKDLSVPGKLKDKNNKYSISSCTKKDVGDLYEMSKIVYSTTRFHNDPMVSKMHADEMQALWIKNCYNQKLADEIIIVREGKKILGYAAIETIKEVSFASKIKIANIILIAVIKESRGKGIGNILVDRCSKWAKSEGCSHLAVGTQIINDSSIRFYQKNGFKLQSSVLSFHKWV